MNYNVFIEAKLEEKGINKKELHKIMKEYFIKEGTGRDSWLEYNTLANKIASNSLSASELLVMAAILDIDTNKIIESIRTRLAFMQILDKKLEDADENKIRFMRSASNVNLPRYYNECKQIKENIFEFISYSESMSRIAIEHFDFNENKCKTVAVIDDKELAPFYEPSEYIVQHEDRYYLVLDDSIKNTIIELKKAYYLLYPEEKDFSEEFKEWNKIPF